MADRAFKLGYSTIGWGPEPDLDFVLGTISGAGYEGVEFISIATDWAQSRHGASIRMT